MSEAAPNLPAGLPALFFVRYATHGVTKTLRPATLIRLTKTLIVVTTDGKTERRFKRENGCETVPGGGFSSNTRLVRADGTTIHGV